MKDKLTDFSFRLLKKPFWFLVVCVIGFSLLAYWKSVFINIIEFLNDEQVVKYLINYPGFFQTIYDWFFNGDLYFDLYEFISITWSYAVVLLVLFLVFNKEKFKKILPHKYLRPYEIISGFLTKDFSILPWLTLLLVSMFFFINLHEIHRSYNARISVYLVNQVRQKEIVRQQKRIRLITKKEVESKKLNGDNECFYRLSNVNMFLHNLPFTSFVLKVFDIVNVSKLNIIDRFSEATLENVLITEEASINNHLRLGKEKFSRSEVVAIINDINQGNGFSRPSFRQTTGSFLKIDLIDEVKTLLFADGSSSNLYRVSDIDFSCSGNIETLQRYYVESLF